MNVLTIYVGHLPEQASETYLRELFTAHGEVIALRLVQHPLTKQIEAFVEMEMSAALTAIEALDGASYDGMILRVNRAREQQHRRERD